MRRLKQVNLKTTRICTCTDFVQRPYQVLSSRQGTEHTSGRLTRNILHPISRKDCPFTLICTSYQFPCEDTNSYKHVLKIAWHYTLWAPHLIFAYSLVLFCPILLAVLWGKSKASLIYKQSKLNGYQICKGLVVISDGDLAVSKGSTPRCLSRLVTIHGIVVIESEAVVGGSRLTLSLGWSLYLRLRLLNSRLV